MNMTRYALDALGLSIDAPEQPLRVDSVLGLALRHNPRRAHLVVSRLLGKHTPRHPDIIDTAGRPHYRRR